MVLRSGRVTDTTVQNEAVTRPVLRSNLNLGGEGHSHAAPSPGLLVRNEAMAPHYSGRLAGEDFKVHSIANKEEMKARAKNLNVSHIGNLNQLCGFDDVGPVML